jgi:hypothetical protein
MKSIPTKDSRYYDSFIESEIDKLKYGVNINGVNISNWLYWHLNYWKIYRPVEDQRSGEVLDQFLHPQLRDNEWIVADALERAKKEKKGVIIVGTRRFAKELLNSSKLYTLDGEIEIGNAKIGDKIFDNTGQLTNIIGVYPQGKVPIYKITLEDKREIFCGLKHNWYVFDRFKQKYIIVTTEEMLKGYIYPRIHNGYKNKITRNIFETRYFIPNNSAVQYNDKDLNIDPYMLGIWLGDGTSTTSEITNTDQEIIDYINNFCKNNDCVLTKKDKITYRISGQKRTKNIFLKFLQNNNLRNNKHIPFDYLHSSIEQRLELLRGLMDTDGHCAKNGTLGYCTNNKQLAQDFYFLCRSLGITLSKQTYIPTCTYKGKKVKGKECTRFTLFTELPIFKLKRKLNNMVIGNKGKQSKITKTAIRNIEYVFDDEATCISVDNEQCLYLTDNFTITHNTTFASSYIGLSSSIREGSQNVIVGNNKADLTNITLQLDKGLANVHKFIKYDRLLDDWRKEVALGYKEKRSGGDRLEWSRIFIRNTQDGNQTELLAGITPTSLLYDEIGKAPIKEAFLAAIPSFTSPFGWRCVPILIGTGGDFTMGQDAEYIFWHPEEFNLIKVELVNEGRSHGIFIPATMSIDIPKIETNLTKYLNVSGGTELDTIPIFVTPPNAEELVIKAREEKAKAENTADIFKYIMYYPLKPEECFLSPNTNDFPTEAISELIKYLEANQHDESIVGTNVRLFRDVEGSVKHSLDTPLKPITDFPVTGATIKEAPVVIYEFPKEKGAYLYIAGGDPYNTSETANSPSLGSVHIYKRMYDPINGTFQKSCVASYTARPKTMKEWHETVELLLEFYNATILPENEAGTFILFFDQKNKGHLIADGYTLAREINPSTSILGRTKGLAATTPNINYEMNLLYQYCNEEIQIGINPDTKEPIKKLGVWRIRDLMLLKEMLAYRPTRKGEKKGNYDRIVSFRHAVTYDNYLDKIAPLIQIDNPDQKKNPQIMASTRTPFSVISANPFGIGGRNPFTLRK